MKDVSGTIEVDPEGAEIRIPADNRYENDSKNYSEGVKKYFEKSSFSIGPMNLDTTSRRRASESFIAPKDNVYVFGTAELKQGFTSSDESRFIIKKGAQNSLFYISDSQEKDVLNGLRGNFNMMAFAGCASFAIGALILSGIL